MRALLRLASAGALLLAAAPDALAGLWRVDPAASSMAIVYRVDDQERRGAFGEFAGEARFEAGALEQATMTLDVVTGSVDVGEPFGTEFVKSIDWLFVEQHPAARYELLRLTPIEGDRYIAEGRLTLRGATNPVSGEVTVRVTETEAAAVGEARFDRAAFGVGVGFSTLFVEIGSEIVVAFDIVARRVD